MTSERSILPMALSLVLLIGITAAWGATLLGSGMISVYAWLVLVQLTVPVLGIFGFLVAMGAFVWKRKEFQWTLVAIALSLTAAWPLFWSFGVLPVAYPADLGDTIPAMTVRLPSNEKLRVVWGGNTIEENHHAFSPDQRWAYDLVVEPAFHGKKDLESYGCFGTPVVAPMVGVVESAANDLEDHVPGEASNDYERPLGNHVVLRVEGGTYLVLAHLKKGSVLVKEGDRVTESQKLGECGNSGNTSEPHIHIHHQRQNPVDHPVGLAEGLPLYFRGHDGNKMPVGGVDKAEDGSITARGDVIQHQD